MKRFIAVVLALLLMIPTGITAMAADTAITSVNLPVSETDFWAGSAITDPVFYSSLECVVGGKVTTVDGFTWECADYKSDTAGTYTFSAVPPTGYTFKCDVPTIKVNMKSGTIYHHIGYYISRDYVGQYVSVVNNVFHDRTGCNPLLTSTVGEGLRFVAGIDYKRKMTEATTANIMVKDTTLTSIFAGSYGTNFIGTSNVYVNGGAITKGLYAGSASGTFDGTTNIYLSGSPIIKEISCGSYYDVAAKTSGSGSIVGTWEVSYNGTVNIYIASDFAGDITSINFADADKINFYISSGAKFNLSKYQLSRSNVDVYIDGVKRNVVSNVEYDGPDFVVAQPGTAEKDVVKESITAHIKGADTVLSGITWESADYSANTEGVYTFTPVLPAGCVLADDVKLPEVDVLVADTGKAVISSVSYENETVIPDGIEIGSLDMPDTVSATFTLNGNTYTYDIPATFTSQDYSSSAGTYSFELAVDDVFTATELPSMQVTVSKSASVTRTGDVYTVTSAGVRFSGEERKNYKITDIAGIYTYFDNVDIVNAVYAKGSGIEIAIDSDVVRVENKIDLNETTGKVVLDIPVALVTRVRYASSIAGNVYINGVRMSEYTNITYADTKSKSYVYANGVPVVIARGEDGGTYLYRANDMSLFYSGDITGWNVFAGGKSSNDLDSTNIAFMSGYVYSVYGGGEGDVKDATFVVDGGSSDYMRGGGMSGSVTEHVTMIIENGFHQEYTMGGCTSDSTVGISTKTYADDEYSIEMHVYGGAYTNIYLGGSGDTYGNIRLIQHGGNVYKYHSSGNGTVYGNIDVMIDGGLLEVGYDTQNMEGKTTFRLYKGILRHDQRVSPIITCDDMTITYFGGPENFKYTEYTNNRDAVISNSGDAGKLVIRFLETRYYGEEKNKVRHVDSIGDCMYITFPNGQNMLVDTGEVESSPHIIETLKELGVTKLDYALMTHHHNDHVGGIKKIATAIPIDTFILQDQATPYGVVTEAIAVNNSQVLYANRYDSMMIGDVEIYALNPKEPIQSHVNTASMATLLTFGETKALLGADTYVATEKDWLSDSIISEKIKDVDLLKPGHHGYPSSNCYNYLKHTSPSKVVVPSPRGYSAYIQAFVYQLTDGYGMNWNDISVTGRQGLTKVTLDGTKNGIKVENEYIDVLPYYADYSRVEDAIEMYNSYSEPIQEEGVALWEEALSLVRYNLPRENQDVVDGMAEHLENVFYNITEGRVISAVDTSGLVMTTKFLYSGKDKAGNVWTSQTAGLVNVTAPVFYATIPVTVGGEKIDLDVTWVSEDYRADVAGTYTFKAVVDGYIWECDAPVITVEVVEGAIGYDGIRGGIITNHTAPIKIIYKDCGLYDATGCNQMFTLGTDRLIFGAALSSVSAGLTRTDAFTAPEYDTNIYASGNIVGSVAGGGYGVDLKGNTNVVVENATLSGSHVGQIFGGGFSNKIGINSKVNGNTNVTVVGTTVTTGDASVYGGSWAYNSMVDGTVDGNTGVTIKNSTITNVYGGGWGRAAVANVTGATNVTVVDSTITNLYAGGKANTSASAVANVKSANVDISGESKITTLYAGGHVAASATASVTETTTINIHDLAETAEIGMISKGTTGKLVIKLDDTSKHLLTDGSITLAEVDELYINDELYMGVVADATLADIPDSIVAGSASTVLPATFGEIAGFTWQGDDTSVGEKTFTLTAPEGYYFEGYVKTKEFTITVTKKIIYVTDVTISGPDKVTAGKEITLTVEVSPSNADDKSVIWSTDSENVELIGATDEAVTVKALAEGTAEISATSGGVKASFNLTVTPKPTVTAVDTSKLVMETVFPYNAGSGDAYWSTYVSNVTNPTFYSTIPATVDGKNTDLPVSWVSENYQSTVFGTYTFTAVAEDYVWECEVPVITVKVVDAGFGTGTTRVFAFGTADPSGLIPAVLKAGSGRRTDVYDATGCNIICETPINSGNSSTNDYNITGGIGTLASTGKTVATSAVGDSRITLDGVTYFTRVFGGGFVPQTGNTYINVKDTTFLTLKSKVAGIYGGGYGKALNGNSYITVSGMSTVPNIYGGGNAAAMTGDAYIDVSGIPTITNIYGGGYSTGATVSGTAYVTIHDLEEGSAIANIARGTASKLVVNLDDTSAHLLSVITDVDTDTDIRVYINGKLYGYADYSAVEKALARVPADLSKYTDVTAQAVTEAVNAVVYDLKADQQETVDGYAKAIEDAVSKLALKPISEAIVLTESMVNYRLRCTTAVVDGNLVLTADPAGTSSMKVRLGNLPEGATVAIVGTNANASMSSGIITVTNPGMKNVNVPMTITSAEGAVTEFVLVADFNNAIRYATYARLSQTGNNITVTSGAATAYVLFDTTEIDGGYVEVENVSRNLLGRYVVTGSAVRFYNPVYDNGTVTVNVKNANGETVATYNVTAIFADATEYTPVLESSLRCTYTVDGNDITVTAIVGATNVYLNFGRYYAETLTASVNDDLVKKMGARSWRIMRTETPVEFDVYFDATAYGAETVTRHVTVNF
ncbi:MAG: MBL fold metallo-hydrolase [Clostridia bacterium]|nr:MBL fold metallo-hydrolase [Clostridia bacterium]